MLPYINIPFIPVAEATGASVDELKLVFSFLLSYPLAALLKRIPDSKPSMKNVFVIGISLFYLVGLFDMWDGIRTLLYSSAGAYAIAYYIDGSLMPWIAFAFLMGHMSISHIIRLFTNSPSTVDISGAQMVLVMKLHSFCWNVHDGRLPREQLSEPQRYSAITEFPKLLDFAAYVFFFPSLFAGPAFEYVDYKRWIETTLFVYPPDVDPSRLPPRRNKRKIPRSGRPAAKKAFFGLLGIFALLQVGSKYGPELLVSDRFTSSWLPTKIWYLYIVALSARFKYYGVWFLTEGACILSGLGYNGFDPRTGLVYWNRLANVDPWGLELAQNSYGYIGSWNKNTTHWLRNYVYLRVTPKGKKPGFRASMATFTTSAFWHGFYPGYYMSFILGSFLQTAAKDVRRNIRPFFLTPEDPPKPTKFKRYYDLASLLTTQLIMSFVITPFILLRFDTSFHTWKSVYFYGIVAVASTLIVFSSPVKPFIHRKFKARTAAAAAAKQTTANITKEAPPQTQTTSLDTSTTKDHPPRSVRVAFAAPSSPELKSKLTHPTASSPLEGDINDDLDHNSTHIADRDTEFNPVPDVGSNLEQAMAELGEEMGELKQVMKDEKQRK